MQDFLGNVKRNSPLIGRIFFLGEIIFNAEPKFAIEIFPLDLVFKIKEKIFLQHIMKSYLKY